MEKMKKNIAGLKSSYFKRKTKETTPAEKYSSVHEEPLVKKMFSQISKKILMDRLSIKEQGFFIKRLSFLINAGVPVTEGLSMIREQTDSRRQARVLDSIIDDVSEGQFLSTALSKFKGMFSDFALNIIAVGESSGILSENLQYLADELKKKQILKRKVIGAFVYPAVVTAATIGITSFLMVYLFPKIMPIFLSLHMTLPLSTIIVLTISNTLINYGWYIIGAIILCAIVFLIILKKSRKVHFYFDRFLLKIPVAGSIVKFYNLASCTRTMGLLLKGGLPLSETLSITAKTTSNLPYKREFTNLTHVVNRGEKMSVYLSKRKKLFPDILTQITSVGERSGNLSNSLIYLSEMYEGEVDDFTKNLSNLIEPIMMIFMGIMVGFIAISIITPIYSITQNLHP